ncbi:MAG: hypothetical protein RIS45_122 [Planctomycetota bacterium]
MSSSHPPIDHGVHVIVVGPRVAQAVEGYRVAMQAYEITGDATDARAVERAALDVAQALDAALEATEALL